MPDYLFTPRLKKQAPSFRNLDQQFIALVIAATCGRLCHRTEAAPQPFADYAFQPGQKTVHVNTPRLKLSALSPCYC
jgi:hypothetical protein